MKQQLRNSEIELSASSLKIIAMITMLIDHIGAALIYYPCAIQGLSVPSEQYLFYRLLRNIGRAAFPIYCFLLVEGLLHTKDKKKYAIRLAIFALVSELPYDLAVNTVTAWQKQNVYFTLFIGFLTICALQEIGQRTEIKAEWKRAILRLAVLAAGMGLAWLLKTDYSYKGVLVIAVLYEFRHTKLIAQLMGFCVLCSNPFVATGFAAPFLYHGKKGIDGKGWQYFCYAFYPMHLLTLYLFRLYVM